MHEDGRRRIDQFFAESALRKERLAQRQEEIRIGLEAQAREVVEKHDKEKTLLEPEAEQAVTDVVFPWWEDFTQEGGAYDQLILWLSDRELGLSRTISITGSIVYPRVDEQRNGLEGENPFDYSSKSIAELEEKGDQEAIERVHRGIVSEEFWTAGLYIHGLPQIRIPNAHGGVVLSRTPLYGWRAVAPAAAHLQRKHDEIAVGKTLPEDLIRKTHPEFVLSFAEKIQSGEIWDVIEESLRRSEEPSRIISREEFYRSEVELYKAYGVKRAQRLEGLQ